MGSDQRRCRNQPVCPPHGAGPRCCSTGGNPRILCATPAISSRRLRYIASIASASNGSRSGVASNFPHSHVNIQDTLEIAAARGTFTLRHGDGPVVLLSGIGATSAVMAMLHALASQHSERAVWWLHGVRNRSEHAFAIESRKLLSSLLNARSHIMYSRAEPGAPAATTMRISSSLPSVQ